MYSKCPGQDFRNLRVALYKCPHCGAEVEIFSDEIKVKCHRCGEKVYRGKIPSCIEWCADEALELITKDVWAERTRTAFIKNMFKEAMEATA